MKKSFFWAILILKSIILWTKYGFTVLMYVLIVALPIQSLLFNSLIVFPLKNLNRKSIIFFKCIYDISCYSIVQYIVLRGTLPPQQLRRELSEISIFSNQHSSILLSRLSIYLLSILDSAIREKKNDNSALNLTCSVSGCSMRI